MSVKVQIRLILFPLIAVFVALLSWQLLQAAEQSSDSEPSREVEDWSPPGTKITQSGVNGSLAKITYSPTNNELIAVFGGWTDGNQDVRDPYYARSTNNGASWSNAVALDSNTNTASPSIDAIHDHDGNTHAVWLSLDITGSYTVTHRERTSGTTTWSTSEVIETETPLGNSAAINATIIESADDVIDIIWEGVIAADNTIATLWHVRSTTGGTSGSWSGKSRVIISNDESTDPSLAADSSGRLHLVWEQRTSIFVTNIYYSRYNGSWSTPVLISSHSAVKDDSYRPTIEVANNKLHVAFIESAADTDPQTVYYRTCSLSNSCTSSSHWSSVNNISSQLFEVNDAPVDVLPTLAYDDTDEVMHLYFYGIRDGASSTNEVLWQNTDCNNWYELESITSDNVQRIYPHVTIENGAIHMVYDNFTSEEVYYMQDDYTCVEGLVNFLPLVTK